jgi:uncharacterized membrane protein YphA (DoxX/SURF4 family)
MFPTGGPGVGLLLLRISIALTVALYVAQRNHLFSIHPIFLGALLVGLCLTIGLLTPYVSFAVCACALVNLFGAASHVEELILASLFLNSAALALLGPGAYSVDARLFGRRVVVFPTSHETD